MLDTALRAFQWSGPPLMQIEIFIIWIFLSPFRASWIVAILLKVRANYLGDSASWIEDSGVQLWHRLRKKKFRQRLRNMLPSLIEVAHKAVCKGTLMRG